MITRFAITALALTIGFAAQAKTSVDVVAKNLVCGTDLGQTVIQLLAKPGSSPIMYTSTALITIGTPGSQGGSLNHAISKVEVLETADGTLRISDNDEPSQAKIFLQESATGVGDQQFVVINGVKLALTCDGLRN